MEKTLKSLFINKKLSEKVIEPEKYVYIPSSSKTLKIAKTQDVVLRYSRSQRYFIKKYQVKYPTVSDHILENAAKYYPKIMEYLLIISLIAFFTNKFSKLLVYVYIALYCVMLSSKLCKYLNRYIVFALDNRPVVKPTISKRRYSSK